MDPTLGGWMPICSLAQYNTKDRCKNNQPLAWLFLENYGGDERLLLLITDKLFE